MSDQPAKSPVLPIDDWVRSKRFDVGSFGPPQATIALLEATLSCAVPLHAEEMKRVPYEELVKRAHEYAQIVGEKGDVIQFKSKTKGATAEAFNALAKALAVLSFSPGGVRFMGMHFENAHPDLAASDPP